MALQAIKILLEQIQNENTLPKHIIVEGELIIRQSAKIHQY